MSANARAYTTRAIVLRARNLGEADKIFTLFTDERGKIDAVGKGVRRAHSRMAGKLEFMSDATLTMHRGRRLDVITSAALEHAHWSDIVEPAKFATAHLIAELIDAFCEPDLSMPEISALLRGALAVLGRSERAAAVVPRFQLRLLEALGLAPPCRTCVRCDRPLLGFAAWADLDAGGLACAQCRPHRADAYELTPPDVLNFVALGAPPRAGATLDATAAAARAIDAFVSWHLGKRPKAGKLLADLAGAGFA